MTTYEISSTQKLTLLRHGQVFELKVEEAPSAQTFSLKGELDFLLDFFTAGYCLLEDCTRVNGDTSKVPARIVVQDPLTAGAVWPDEAKTPKRR